MTLSLKHSFTSVKGDGLDATLVQPSNWNAEHTFTVAADTLVGRSTAGAGAVEEVPCTSFGRSVLAASSILFSWLSSLPTTLAGYGITDAVNKGTENQAFSGGVAIAVKDLGTGSGTITLDVADRPIQKILNDGAFTLAPGSIKGTCLLTITNGASAGTISTPGFTKVTGDAFTTTNGHKWQCQVVVDDDGDSLLQVVAMQ